jgi:Arc/MetJ family transcription regulator
MIDAGGLMRTTITIDDDVLSAARQLAQLRHEPIGKVVSDLARRSLQGPADGLNSVDRTVRRGIQLLPTAPGAQGATLDEVNRLRDNLV